MEQRSRAGGRRASQTGRHRNVPRVKDGEFARQRRQDGERCAIESAHHKVRVTVRRDPGEAIHRFRGGRISDGFREAVDLLRNRVKVVERVDGPAVDGVVLDAHLRAPGHARVQGVAARHAQPIDARVVD